MTLSTPPIPRVTHAALPPGSGTDLLPGSRTDLPRGWRVALPRGWRAAAGLTSVAAGATIVAGALLPWVSAFAGLVQVPGVRGLNGRILAAAGVLIAVTGLYQLVRGGTAARWVAGLAGFAAAGFAGYLLIALTRTMRALGGDSMVFARGGPGLWVAAAGSAAAFATLLFPPAASPTPRPAAARRVLAWAADRESAGPRRALQVTLGVVWLLDAALQFQPYMFSKMFPAMMLAPSGMGGEPAFVSGPVLGAARLFSSAPGARTRGATALGATAPRASIAEGSPLGRYARLAWLVLWGALALLILRAPASAAPLTAAGGSRAVLVIVGLAVAFGLAAAGMLVPATARAAVLIAAVAAAFVWAAGESFGSLFSGAATDPNSGPLLLLIAAAFWPRRQR